MLTLKRAISALTLGLFVPAGFAAGAHQASRDLHDRTAARFQLDAGLIAAPTGDARERYALSAALRPTPRATGGVPCVVTDVLFIDSFE